VHQPSRQSLALFRRLKSIRGYASSLTALLAVTLIGLLIRGFVTPQSISMLYLVAVILSALYWGLGPSILSSVLAVLLVDAVFDPPYGLFSPSGLEDLIELGVFLGVGIVISELGSRVRAQVRELRRREQQTNALYSLSRSMVLAEDRMQLLDAVTDQIAQVFGGQVVTLLPSAEGGLQPNHPIELDDTECRAARWAFEHGTPAGHGSSRVGEARHSYLPLITVQGTFGVIGLQAPGADVTYTAERQRLLETFVGQIAIALEHAKLREQAEQARVFEASERFRNTLLSSLSHDLLTPITSVIGSVTTLLDGDAGLDVATRRDLLENAKEDSMHLARLVGSLLDMTRLEAGVLEPRRDWYSIEDVVGAALPFAEAKGRRVRLNLEPRLPLIHFDFVLIEQVLLNLLDNAYKFSSPDSPIDLSARLQDGYVQLSLADRGEGVPNGELMHIFEKFYRLNPNGNVRGTGLGLSICKGIVEAHGGRIWAERREGGGTRFTFTLPAGKAEAAG
jgi:two-component system sensor histidine kinase KdpD